MKMTCICALLVSASLGLAACNKAEPPEKVQADVDKAAAEASENSAKADETRKQTEAQAADELAKAKADAEAKAADKSVGAVADAAVVDTEGETKVALAKCQSLEGDAQKQCKDAAKQHLQTVKDRAAAAKKGD
jgi:hypothetical protein